MKYLLLGAGLQGTAIAFDLLRAVTDTAKLTVVDGRPAALAALTEKLSDARLATVVADVRDSERLAPLAREADVVISAVNYWFNVTLTDLALEHRCHFVDLGGNNDVVARQFARDGDARRRGVCVLPDCGLAPGLAGILAYDLQRPFTEVESLRIRVGGLPLDPRPPLDYELQFAVQGLINEYVEPAQVIREGTITTVPPLTEIETLRFPPPLGELEAFQTSGGISTLPRSLSGRVRHLDYKTIRYPGHAERIRLLLELGLLSSEPVPLDGDVAVVPRELLGRLLEKNLPPAGADVVIVLIQTEGMLADDDGEPAAKGPVPRRRSLRIIDHADAAHGISAMARMTGYPVAIVARLLAAGAIAQRGVCRPELVVPADRVLEELSRRGVVCERWDADPATPE